VVVAVCARREREWREEYLRALLRLFWVCGFPFARPKEERFDTDLSLSFLFLSFLLFQQQQQKQQYKAKKKKKSHSHAHTARLSI
jgi:hypothetical protein